MLEPLDFSLQGLNAGRQLGNLALQLDHQGQ